MFLPLLVGATGSGMTTLLQAVTDIVTNSVSWITTTVGAVMQSGNELLLFFVLSSFVGIGIGLLMRFVRR